MAFGYFSLFSCGEEIVYRDFPVEFSDVNEREAGPGEKNMALGVYEEESFREIDEGDSLPIINGLQGGTWVHLSVRVSGLPRSGNIAVQLGNGIGSVEYSLKLLRTAEGFLEAYDIPIPVPFEGEELEALFGTTVSIKVEYSADSGAVTAETLVVLEKG